MVIMFAALLTTLGSQHERVEQCKKTSVISFSRIGAACSCVERLSFCVEVDLHFKVMR